MRLCKRFSLLAIATLLTILAGCGGSNSTSTPTPTGGFTNANVNGAYAISFSGNDSSNSFFAVAGTITANGSGAITGGVMDINRAAGVLTNIAVTGTYNTRADGRGVISLTSSAGNFSLVFSLVNANRALISRFEASANGTGSMDLQSSSAFSTTAVSGQFAYNISGIDSVSNPFASVGTITTDTTGTLTAGIEDSSDDGGILQAAAITAGTITVAANGRGTATLNTASGVLNFALYVVDVNHIKLIEIDSTPVLAGDAFRQSGPFTNAALSGPFAFTLGGADIVGGPFAAGGVFSANGAGAFSGVEDVNDGGNVNTTLTMSGGTYAVAANGRGTATIATPLRTVNLAFYPSTHGVQVIEIDTGLVASGTAFQQSGALATAAVNGNYAMNYTGVSTGGSLDANSQFAANGTGGLSGIIDINNAGSLSTGTSLTGTYAPDATGRGPLTFTTALGPQNLAIYVVDSTHAIFIDLDTNIVALGEMDHR